MMAVQIRRINKEYNETTRLNRHLHHSYHFHPGSDNCMQMVRFSGPANTRGNRISIYLKLPTS